ncbi:MAG: (2Fe-2S)-binding protein [Rhodospirillaceae bacterium]|nr:(2Fe-2S)-binding protein [Rhodospirillaceae bacterium]
MYVCICNALRRSQIEAAARRGATTVEAAYAACDSQVQCGQCREDAVAVIAATHADAATTFRQAAE